MFGLFFVAETANADTTATSSGQERPKGMLYSMYFIGETACVCDDDGCLQAKQKKMRDKYGDQDEEERELRMKILAVSSLYTLDS